MVRLFNCFNWNIDWVSSFNFLNWNIGFRGNFNGFRGNIALTTVSIETLYWNIDPSLFETLVLTIVSRRRINWNIGPSIETSERPCMLSFSVFLIIWWSAYLFISEENRYFTQRTSECLPGDSWDFVEIEMHWNSQRHKCRIEYVNQKQSLTELYETSNVLFRMTDLIQKARLDLQESSY